MKIKRRHNNLSGQPPLQRFLSSFEGIQLSKWDMIGLGVFWILALLCYLPFFLHPPKNHQEIEFSKMFDHSHPRGISQIQAIRLAAEYIHDSTGWTNIIYDGIYSPHDGPWLVLLKGDNNELCMVNFDITGSITNYSIRTNQTGIMPTTYGSLQKGAPAELKQQ